MERFEGEAYSSDTWDWALDQIPWIAAKYRDVDSDDLGAELQSLLLKLRRKPELRPNDWKPYLVECMLNRALSIATKLRRVRSHELPFDIISKSFEPGSYDASEPKAKVRLNRLPNFDRQLVIARSEYLVL